jgi:hypothetical protein
VQGTGLRFNHHFGLKQYTGQWQDNRNEQRKNLLPFCRSNKVGTYGVGVGVRAGAGAGAGLGAAGGAATTAGA